MNILLIFVMVYVTLNNYFLIKIYLLKIYWEDGLNLSQGQSP